MSFRWVTCGSFLYSDCTRSRPGPSSSVPRTPSEREWAARDIRLASDFNPTRRTRTTFSARLVVRWERVPFSIPKLMTSPENFPVVTPQRCFYGKTPSLPSSVLSDFCVRKECAPNSPSFKTLKNPADTGEERS